jgi:thioredoxin 1
MTEPILMDFHADWCGPCRMQGPILEEIKSAFDGRVLIKKIDVDKEGELASKYGIFVVPTLILEKDGLELGRWMGVTSKDELTKALNSALE